MIHIEVATVLLKNLINLFIIRVSINQICYMNKKVYFNEASKHDQCITIVLLSRNPHQNFVTIIQN